MKKIKPCFLALFILAVFFSEASVNVKLRLTKQGYWYAKSNESIFSKNRKKLKIPLDVAVETNYDLYKMSPSELVCFFSGTLRTDHPVIKKLKFWNHIETNGLTIPDEDIRSIRTDISVLQNELKNRKFLFEKIKAFWNVKENITAYCFYSKSDNVSAVAVGQWISNFHYSNSIYCTIIMLMPSLSSHKMGIAEHLAVIAHEFSHAMYDVSDHKKLEKILVNMESPNATIVGLYLDEALAVVFGNKISKELISKKKIDLIDEDRCAPGFAPALYNIAKDYWEKSKPIDEAFLSEAVRLFDKIYPNGYLDPNICLYKLHVICPDFVSESDLFLKLSERTPISNLCVTHYSELNDTKLKEIKRTNATILILQSSVESPNLLKKMLSTLDIENQSMVITNKNKKTYVFLKIDDKHSLEDRIDELFS
jgi:hypothetical protein